jgi:hypothetical protein
MECSLAMVDSIEINSNVDINSNANINKPFGVLVVLQLLDPAHHSPLAGSMQLLTQNIRSQELSIESPVNRKLAAREKPCIPNLPNACPLIDADRMGQGKVGLQAKPSGDFRNGFSI